MNGGQGDDRIIAGTGTNPDGFSQSWVVDLRRDNRAEIRVRVDMTEDKVFTLSQGSKDVMGKISSPVILRFYYTRGQSEVPVHVKNFAKRVEDLGFGEGRVGGHGGALISHGMGPYQGSRGAPRPRRGRTGQRRRRRRPVGCYHSPPELRPGTTA